MKPIKREGQQPVSDLLRQLDSYHDLSTPIALPEVVIEEYAPGPYTQADPIRYNPEAIRRSRENRNKTVFQKLMESSDDSWQEDLWEAVEPTGIYSWDDARDAWKSMRSRGGYRPTGDEALDMLGAVPGIGKSKLLMKLPGYGFTKSKDMLFRIGDMLEAAGFLQDRTQE